MTNSNSYFPQLIQESDPIEKKTLAKQTEFSLILKILIVFHDFGHGSGSDV